MIEEQSAEHFSKLLARHEACAEGDDCNTRERGRVREKRSDEEGEIVSYECGRSHDLAALPKRSLYGWLGTQSRAGRGIKWRGRALPPVPEGGLGRVGFAVAITYN